MSRPSSTVSQIQLTLLQCRIPLSVYIINIIKTSKYVLYVQKVCRLSRRQVGSLLVKQSLHSEIDEVKLRRPVLHLEPSKHQPKDGIYIPYPSYSVALQRFIMVHLYNAMNCVGTTKSNLSTKFDSKYIILV